MTQQLIKSWFPEYRHLQNRTADELLFFIFGFLATMPVLMFRGNTVFLYLLLITTGYGFLKMLFCYRAVYLDINVVPPIAIGICAIISTILCLLSNIPMVFRQGEEIRIVWETLYTAFFVLLYCVFDNGTAQSYVKGVYYASVFHLLWGYAQFFYYKFAQGVLNSVVFEQLLGMQSEYGYGVYESGGTPYLTGLCWHPSNMAPLMVVGYLFSKSYVTKGLFLVMGALCGSRTAFLGLCICFFGEIVWCIKKSDATIIAKKLILKVFIFALIGCVIYFVFINNTILNGIVDMILLYINKTVNFTNNNATSAHLSYWLKIPEGFRIANPLQVLFGFGPECSGYVGSSVLNMYVGQKWVLECDYVNILWSYGVTGFLCRYLWYVKRSFYACRYNPAKVVFVIAFAVMGVVYNVMFNWVIILIYSLIVIGLKEEQSVHTVYQVSTV